MKIDERLKRCCGRYFAPSIKCEEGSRCSDCFDKLEGLREIERLREALQKIVDFDWQFKSDGKLGKIEGPCAAIARSALQQKVS